MQFNLIFLIQAAFGPEGKMGLKKFYDFCFFCCFFRFKKTYIINFVSIEFYCLTNCSSFVKALNECIQPICFLSRC